MNFLRPSTLLVTLAAATLVQGQVADRSGPAAWLGNLSLSAASSATWVDNISRTANVATRHHAMTYDFSVRAVRHQQLAPSWLLHLGADATYLAVPEYDLTSSAKLGVHAGVQKKFGLGPFAPVLHLDAGSSYKAARLAGDRGWTTDATLRLSKRVGPALQVAVTGQWLKHDASSTLFALQQRTWSAEANWDINDRWRLTGSAGRLTGTIVANAAWPVWAKALSGGFGPVAATYYNANPWAVTDLYGPGWASYRVEAAVDLWSLALAFEASPRLSLELRTSSAFVVNKIGVTYPTKSWGLGLNYRF